MNNISIPCSACRLIIIPVPLEKTAKNKSDADLEKKEFCFKCFQDVCVTFYGYIFLKIISMYRGWPAIVNNCLWVIANL